MLFYLNYFLAVEYYFHVVLTELHDCLCIILKLDTYIFPKRTNHGNHIIYMIILLLNNNVQKSTFNKMCLICL